MNDLTAEFRPSERDAPDREERLAGILDAYMAELEATGVPPDVDALAAHHPDLADELRSYAESLRVLHHMTAGLRADDLTPASSEAPPAGPAPRRRLGDYELLREIGRGGMGIVYEARQLSLARRVALKVLPFAAVLDEKQIARFRTEAQAAAQLHHPHIVPVHAVGQERGVHFFAMQYVAGQSLEAAIGELRGEPQRGARHGDGAEPAGDTPGGPGFSTRISARSRNHCQSVARLGVQAAEALHHAHEYGIVHRDVKPSNLLVDRDGKLWVTDFGLARIQSGPGVTVSGDVVGTLRYMSPEQARGAGALVDGRTDVYSLGATLYEMLTLTPAFGGENRNEVLRLIETRDPTAPRKLNPSVPVDLETIVMRAMAKSRDERYATAQELADDLNRFLAGKATLARRPTPLDRAAKWAMRRRRSVTLAAACLLLMTAVSATSWLLVAAEQRRTADALEVAQQNALRAERNFEHARDVVDDFAGVAQRLAGLPGAQPVRRVLLSDTLGYYHEFIEQAAGDARLRRRVAETRLHAGAISEQLGDHEAAQHEFRAAAAAFDQLLRDTPQNSALLAERARCSNNLGASLAAAGDLAAARDAYADAIEVQLSIVEGDPDRVRALAETFGNLGLLEAQAGRHRVAAKTVNRAVELLSAMVREQPDNRAAQHALAIAYNNLSYVARASSWRDALEACDRAIELLRRLDSDAEASADERRDVAVAYNNRGAILGHLGEWEAAIAAHRAAIEPLEHLARTSPAIVDHQRELAVTWNNLGQAYDACGATSDAADAYLEAREIAQRLARDYPTSVGFRSLLAGVLNNQAMAQEHAGKTDQALKTYRLAIDHQSTALEAAPRFEEFRDLLSKHYYNYARALRDANNPARAAQVALKRRALWPGEGARLHSVAVELALAAQQLRRDPGAAEEAEQVEEQAIATLREAIASGYEPPDEEAGALENLLVEAEETP